MNKISFSSLLILQKSIIHHLMWDQWNYKVQRPQAYNVTHISYNSLHTVVKLWDHHFIYTPVALWEGVGGLKTVILSNESLIAIETLATLSWFTEPLCAPLQGVCLMCMLLNDNGGDLQTESYFWFQNMWCYELCWKNLILFSFYFVFDYILIFIIFNI